MKTPHDRQQAAAPGAVTAFARFTLLGGTVGLASSLTVAALATQIPWGLANALVTALSTLLATDLHARFSFGAGTRATGRQHLQSAGSAAAAFALTCTATFVLHQLTATPGAMLEQSVYLTASALAGLARFTVLRLVVFARGSRFRVAADRTARPVQARVADSDTMSPAGPTLLCRAA
ncbi:hypothetical protein [Streptomyces sp. M41(2017)]|uniref:hypothetical protein n=1 Tax=unclassified Streptomyces TaxID=2593676 RepID=UPI0009BF7F82|nr:hypothetical protein [Streptomyces sp. M41(2017)]OQQ13684.1 hypothetical protein B0675_25795 [Streptomyces sp. M41(2017)]